MDDAKIVELYWKRDEQAILATSKKYEAYCLSIARNILGDEEDAKECVNDALLGAWNSIPPNRPEQLSAYLGKLVRNVSFNRYKKSRTKKRGSGQIPAILEELTEVVSGTDDVETVWSEKYLWECINDFLKLLPEKKRNLFVCRYWYADSVKHMAGQFDMSENYVSVTLRRLRKKLHRYLIERGFEL